MTENIPNETPTFNLKVVVRETGLKPDTLRVWEKRYGIPNPQRTEGGHRLYSQYDIEILKWLVARQDEGLRISRAVKMWKQLLADGENPLLAVPTPTKAPPNQQIAPAIEGGDALIKLRQAWVSACLTYDQEQAEHALNQAFALYPVETVCLHLLQAGLRQIGMGWYEGEISVQQEHFASSLMMRRIEALLVGTPSPTRNGRVLLACPPEEEHTISPLLLNLFLRRRGWHVIDLGANVPIARLQTTIAMVKPDLIILVAQLLPTAASLYDMCIAIQDTHVPIAFGGAIFSRTPNLAENIPGHYLGETIEAAVQQAEDHLSGFKLLSVKNTGSLNGRYQPTLQEYINNQKNIEADLWELVVREQLTSAQLSTANRHLGQNIVAALKLGYIDALHNEMDWIRGLLQNHGPSTRVLHEYLRIYHQTAKRYLTETSQPILSWLDTLSNGSLSN
jgi:DNA-binding transcriptional MerR regulator